MPPAMPDPQPPAPPPTAPAPAPGAAETLPGPDTGRIGWGPALAAGVVAGLVAWAGGESVERTVTAPIVSEFTVAGSQQFARRAAVLVTRSSLAYGLLGAALGLALGLVGGRARRSARGALVGGLAGLVLGGAAGAGAARILVPFFLRNENTAAEDLVLPLLTHGGIGAALGLASGLALGLGLGGPPGRAARAALGGLLGGVVAMLIFETAGAIAFPLDQTGQPLSASAGSRLFGRVVVALGVALLATLAAQPSSPRSAAPPPPATA